MQVANAQKGFISCGRGSPGTRRIRARPSAASTRSRRRRRSSPRSAGWRPNAGLQRGRTAASTRRTRASTSAGSRAAPRSTSSPATAPSNGIFARCPARTAQRCNGGSTISSPPSCCRACAPDIPRPMSRLETIVAVPPLVADAGLPGRGAGPSADRRQHDDDDRLCQRSRAFPGGRHPGDHLRPGLDRRRASSPTNSSRANARGRRSLSRPPARLGAARRELAGR